MVVADASGGEEGARISPKGCQGEEEAEEAAGLCYDRCPRHVSRRELEVVAGGEEV